MVPILTQLPSLVLFVIQTARLVLLTLSVLLVLMGSIYSKRVPVLISVPMAGLELLLVEEVYARNVLRLAWLALALFQHVEVANKVSQALYFWITILVSQQIYVPTEPMQIQRLSSALPVQYNAKPALIVQITVQLAAQVIFSWTIVVFQVVPIQLLLIHLLSHANHVLTPVLHALIKQMYVLLALSIPSFKTTVVHKHVLMVLLL